MDYETMKFIGQNLYGLALGLGVGFTVPYIHRKFFSRKESRPSWPESIGISMFVTAAMDGTDMLLFDESLHEAVSDDPGHLLGFTLGYYAGSYASQHSVKENFREIKGKLTDLVKKGKNKENEHFPK